MSSRATTEALRQRGLRLAWFIIGWDLVEGIVAVAAGLAAGSIAVVGFGIDSSIEVFAAAVVVWQLRGGARVARQPVRLPIQPASTPQFSSRCSARFPIRAPRCASWRAC